MHLIYFADPMCSWCYGFGPELAKLVARHPYALLELVMGGLRPFNRQPMSEAFRAMLLEHWQHVAQASGRQFSRAAIDREDFIYDTEPACRAVVTARHLDADKAFALLESVQLAFYRDGRDTTSPEVLADVAQECGHDRAAFLAAFGSAAMRAETQSDFARTQATGVGGFPTLAVLRGEQLYLVSSGFASDDVLQHRLDEIERLTKAAESSAG
jgi:putative protein-disulfide isomerase